MKAHTNQYTYLNCVQERPCVRHQSMFPLMANVKRWSSEGDLPSCERDLDEYMNMQSVESSTRALKEFLLTEEQRNDDPEWYNEWEVLINERETVTTSRINFHSRVISTMKSIYVKQFGTF